MTSFGWWHQSGSPSFKVIPNGFEGGPKLAFRVIYSKIVVVFTGAQKSGWEVPRKYSRSIWMFFRISKMYKPKCSKFLSRVFSPESRLFSPESRLFLPELKSAKSAKNCPDRIFEGYEILIFGVSKKYYDVLWFVFNSSHFAALWKTLVNTMIFLIIGCPSIQLWWHFRLIPISWIGYIHICNV